MAVDFEVSIIVSYEDFSDRLAFDKPNNIYRSMMHFGSKFNFTILKIFFMLPNCINFTFRINDIF